jgi:hypothetical protein
LLLLHLGTARGQPLLLLLSLLLRLAALSAAVYACSM